MLLDGVHLLSDALRAGTRLVHVVVVSNAGDRAELDGLLKELAARAVAVEAAGPRVMEALSPVDSPSAIVALAERPGPDRAKVYGRPDALVVIAADVQDPGNLGAIVRVAEAAGASGVVSAGTSADPFGWKALRGSMGSALRLPILKRASVEEELADAKRVGCKLIATAPRGGRALFDVDLTGRTALVIGGEGGGLAPSLIASADERVTIPMQPPVESLNTAVAAGLILYEARRQRTRLR
jgi:TrmH family RNA methyltransferase